MCRSLDDGAKGISLGISSSARIDSFFLHSTDTDKPDDFSQTFVARLYSDVSISYADIKLGATDRGPDQEHQVEELVDGWRYNVRSVKFHAKLMRRVPRGGGTCLHSDIRSSSFENLTMQ